MEWSPGELVWFEHGAGHWLPGEVLEYHKSANILTVQATLNGKSQTYALPEGESSVRKREDLGPNGIDDMIQMNDLHEASTSWNLKVRYEKNVIYTNIGSILVAVNPYRTLDANYDVESAKNYKNRRIGELPPHLFAIGSAAYSALPNPQVVIATGESGSGKTESIKLIMQYLATTTMVPKNIRIASTSGLVTEQILETIPLLEAFGNARTLRNDNSSRFGKHLEIYFKKGFIVGAKITQYLLQKSRIVSQVAGERNYHVFYELLGGLSGSEKQKYGLVDAEKYFYLNQGGGDCDAGHCGSGADWRAIKRAMEVLGIEESEQEVIVKVLSSILHLGNIYFHRKQLRNGQECVEFGSDAELKWISHLLKIPITSLQKCLTARFVETRNDRIFTPLTIDQALDARDALAKTLYSALFNWLISRINSVIQRGGLHDANRISLLDIFGFENLLENSFEQLCINFASESLQHYFNKAIFKFEQQEYIKERLEWNNSVCDDNSPILHLLGKKPVGILHLLDDESNFPRASDASFLEKCHYNHALNEYYCRPRVGNAREFGIRHYAGQVWYNVDGFLENNRDILRPDILEVLALSKDNIVDHVVKPMLSQLQFKTLPRETNGRFVTMKPRTPTVAARFGDGLHQLFDSMSNSNLWFIRCIKPNNDKLPMRFDMSLVLHQLKYLAVVNTIKMRKFGYPHKMKFQAFVERYKYLLSDQLQRGSPYKELCRSILGKVDSVELDGLDYQLGTTRVFMREALERQLETVRANILNSAAIILQKHFRCFMARKRYKALKRSSVIIQKTWRGYKQRKQFQKLRNGVTKAQAIYRGRKQRKIYQTVKQELKRRKVEEEKFNKERANIKAQQKESATVLPRQQKIESRPKSQTPPVRVIKTPASPSLLPPPPPPPQSSTKSVQHLEVPAELAFVFSKLDNYETIHSERNLMRVSGGISGKPSEMNLPADLSQFNFRKFCSVYFQGAEPQVRHDPIIAPFLSKAATRDQDFQDALAIFKLILRWSNDTQLTPLKEKVLADYIVYKGLNSRGLRDEILIQLCNQIWKNDQSDRIWHLMAHCLSCFQPSSSLSKYLLMFVTDYAKNGYKELLQQKILRGFHKIPHTRKFPSNILEWRSMRQKCDMAMPLTLYDGSMCSVYVDSWISCEEASNLVLKSQEIPTASEGWSVILDNNGIIYDANGYDFLHDLVAEIEMCPAFPIPRSDLLKFDSRRKPSDHMDSPISMTTPTMKTFKNNNSPVPMTNGYSNNHKEGLSRSSALNERYFESVQTKSRSLDDLLNEDDTDMETVSGLGLSKTSRLNDRYRNKNYSIDNLSEIDSRLNNYLNNNDNYDNESSILTVQKNDKRAKSQNKKFLSVPKGGYMDKCDSLRIRSSAMSDTSEAPSLASHVRRVRVPSQASDVDQFLDELFNPVLDGNLDEMSDARSLAASLKGGDPKCNNQETGFEDFLDNLLNFDEIDYTIDPTTIKGGGNKKDNTPTPRKFEENGNVDEYITGLFNPIFVNENVRQLSTPSLAESIKGSGPATTNTTTSNQKHPINNINGSSAMDNMASLQNNPELVSYQQNLQRAFLQSAMAQNIQIQQQLLAQNQALQQLLSQNNNDNRESGVKTAPVTKIDKNGYKSPPPPPPMPPPVLPVDPSETRHFMDPYGRAKTVRIGKWRWPPPNSANATGETSEEDFLQFKMMRHNNQKVKSPLTANQQPKSNGVEWEEIEFDETVVKPKKFVSNNSKRAFEIGAARPTPGSIGKLKLSSEMRQRLEKVTAHHSVRSSTSSIDKQPGKLEDTRKMMLEQQLAGRSWDSMNGSTMSLNESPSPEIRHHNGWRMDQPPPPPDTIPPVPTKPAPEPPKFLEKRDSFLAHRQDRDTFGVHRNTNEYDDDDNGNDDDESKNSFTNNWRNRNNFLVEDQVDNNRGMISSKTTPDDRPTYRTHQLNKAAKDKERKLSNTNSHKIDIKEWQESTTKMGSSALKPTTTTPIDMPKVHTLNNTACITYSRIPWSLRVRKDYFTPAENLGSPQVLHIIFCQIVSDILNLTPCLRLTPNERKAGLSMLNNYDINEDNFTGKQHTTRIKRHVIDLAISWALYFSKLFLVSGANQMSKIEIVAVSHWGVHLVKREVNHLNSLHSISLMEITGCSAPRPSTLSLDSTQGKVTLHTSRALQIVEMVLKFCNEKKKIQPKISVKSPNPDSNDNISPSKQNGQRISSPLSILKPQHSENGIHSPTSTGQSPVDVSLGSQKWKHTLQQFAMKYFRQSSEFQKNKDKLNEVLRWQNYSLKGPLLKLENEEFSILAVECFDCILQYCGDTPIDSDMSEVKCVYSILMHCHKFRSLCDEIYCQLIKQLTLNKSENADSTQRLWRLMSIFTAYFTSSENLQSIVFDFLTFAASDRKRICHGIASICLGNLRKTHCYGGRKNVPSVEEVTAVSAGRSARRQIYRLPGGAERIVNTRCSTVVEDVIAELCDIIGVHTELEQQEFSIYCIVQGDAFTMPLASDEYILDVTTELQKTNQPFYLIFCRSVWFHPLRNDSSPLYTEVLFNQIAPDYLEGLLLRLGSQLPTDVIHDIALIACLLHRAADFPHTPTLKEIKFLLPKPLLVIREPRPQQWLQLVQQTWNQVTSLSAPKSKHRVLEILATWSLFGSSFFAVKHTSGDTDNWLELILALNRNGVLFLDLNTHETMQHWPFSEVISTRKVRSEDGALFLDLKCGNLMQQKVTRLQSDQAHEISRLIRQYISLEQIHMSRTPR